MGIVKYLILKGNNRMKKMMALSVVTATILIGCAVSSPIMQADKSKSGFADAFYEGVETVIQETPLLVTEYRIFHQGATWFTPLTAVRNSVEKRAKDYCREKDKKILRLREHTSVPPHVTGNWPRFELVFACIED